jgi:hypothetical protein
VLDQFVKWAWSLNLMMAVMAIAFIAIPVRWLDSQPLLDCPGPVPGNIVLPLDSARKNVSGQIAFVYQFA